MARSAPSAVVLTFVLALIPRADAATFTVNSTLDAVDAAPGNGTCATAGAVCTLRAAVMEANALAGADIINVPAGTFTLTIAGQNEEAAATGDLDITSDVDVFGAGEATTILDGGALDRIFDIRAGAATVTLEDLTLRNGDTTGFGGAVEIDFSAGAAQVTVRDATVTSNVSDAFGGGLSNTSATATLELFNVDVTDNTSSGFGGGINNNDNGTIRMTGGSVSSNSTPTFAGGVNNNLNGTIEITGTTISDNTSGSFAGGVNNNSGGTMTLTGVTVANNIAAGFCGGGINNNSGGTMSVTDSDITGNRAQNGGGLCNNSGGAMTVMDTNITGNQAVSVGGIGGGGVINNSTGSLTVTGTTISGNSTSGSGGGLTNNFTGTATITNSTISGNSSTIEGGGVYQNNVGDLVLTFVTISGNSAPDGANIRTNSGPPQLGNTIVANPTGSTNCSGAMASLGGNVFSDASCSATGADRASTNPLLGPLQNNGGRTNTHALLAGSPARDFAVGCIATDQRGVARPQGPACDSGSFEAAPGAVTADLRLTKSDSPDPLVLGQNLTYTIAVTNLGPGGATGVTVVDNLPPTATFVSASSTVGSCVRAGTTVTCTIGALASSASATITIVVTPAAAGSLTNTATVSATQVDPVAANNSATATTTVSADAVEAVPALSWPMLLLFAMALVFVALRARL